ncbi:hypothetical protein [Pseudalkalibacillus sp. NRS-1564]|uniref:hypothetical protein n=1 Tax=Pseudalkalibacillus sp. NRS-1564 TaxID=3233900 RepID=UPI003D27FE4C
MVQEDVIDTLQMIYKDTADWLKFVETKNAALLTLTGVILFGEIRIVVGMQPTNLIHN